MSEVENPRSMAYKSGYPINSYLLVIMPVILIMVFVTLNLNIAVLTVYLPIAAIIFYIFFSRQSCRIEISEQQEMKVVYFFPWDKNVTIDLRKFKYMDYARGFYNPFDSRRIGYLSLFRTCYDLIILSDNINDAQLEIKVNSRIFSFRKVTKHFQNTTCLQLIKLRSINEIIW